MNEVVQLAEFERQVSAMDSTTLAVIARQEIDVQIATAHRFPRSIKSFRSDVLDMATLNEETAAECSYALPRDGKTIEGPSARFAELLLSAWGNCRAAARVVSDDGVFITAQGLFHDLQKNSAVAFEVRRRITNKHGKRFNDDMIGVAGNAAASIALRNAILKGIPKALWADLWMQARETAIGKHRPMTNRRAEALKLFQGYGVTPDRVFAFLSIRGEEEITTDHLMTLRGLATAFKEGDTTPEQVFADHSKEATVRSMPKPINDRLKEFGSGTPAPEPETPTENHPVGEPAPSPSVAQDDGAGVNEDPIEKARAAGRQACRDGQGMETIPPMIARYKLQKAAWEEGYQAEGELMEVEMNQ